MYQIDLSLDPKTKTRPKDDHPVVGYCAIGFGVAGIFLHSLVFVPLALMFSLAALLAGHITWGMGGFLLVVIGVLTSPVILALLGLGALAVWLGLVA